MGHAISSEGDDRTTERPTDREIWLLEWNGKGERKTKTAAKKKFIAERQDKRGRKEGERERGREGDRGRSDNAVHATSHMWRTEEGNRVRVPSFLRSFVLPLIYGPIRFCPKSGRAS